MTLDEMKLEYMNSKVGELNKYDGVECSKCLNRGFIYILEDDEIKNIKCECDLDRKTAINIKTSGLEDNFKRYSIDNYKTDKPFQKLVKDKALKFIKEHKQKNALGYEVESWFYIAGQVGSGKSHICTAILKELYKQRLEFAYLDYANVMPQLTVELKSFYTDIREKAEKQLDQYKNVKILYIDDFMKTKDDQHLFDLINSRYGKNNLITIISSERIFDRNEIGYEALPSRIYERCGSEYYITLGKDIDKNMRVK